MFNILFKLSRYVPGVSKIMFFIYNFDCPRKVHIGTKTKFRHYGNGCVIHPRAIIGDNCSIQHHVTIGVKKASDKPPVIGNNVEIGAYTIIIGNISIGNNVIIGAGSFINKDIPDDAIVYNKKECIITKTGT